MADDHEQNKLDAEASIKRNPHPDFKKVEGSRPDWSELEWNMSKTRDPSWHFGQGATDGGDSLKKKHVEIDPYEEGRPAASNYKLLISGIIPRPIGFLSTRSLDGESTNLAPMSYTQVVCHDPPVFVVGFAGGYDNAKDSLKNLLDTKECVINMISEHFLEAANATSIDAPYGVSEWSLSGLTPAPSTKVKASRVKEAVFSIEGRLMETKEFESPSEKGKKTGVLAIVEGTHFWVREDAINDEKSLIDPAVLKAMSRLGGITYARTTNGIEIPRPQWAKESHSAEFQQFIRPKADAQ